MQAADQPLTSPAANLNAVLGNLAGLDSLKAIFKRMPGHMARHTRCPVPSELSHGRALTWGGSV